MSTRIDGAACQIIPDDLYTSGEPSLNNLAAAAGDRFDVWQRQINRIILAKSADGFWSARNAVLSIPRQTGKTYDIGWVAIHRAARTPGMRIVWTAQHFSVIKDTFESMCAIVLRPEMSGLVDPDHGISLAAGKEEIRFRNGSRIFFRAREIFVRCGTAFPGLLVLGLALMITCQALLHVMVTVNLMPETGQTLPLISRGGSSVLFTVIALGMILSVSRQNDEHSHDTPRSESIYEK